MAHLAPRRPQVGPLGLDPDPSQRDPVIITITGGRDRSPTLAELERARPIFEAAEAVREGEAPGTDKSVAAWLRAREISRVEAFPADWDKFKDKPGKNPAGVIRNGVMLDGEQPAQLEIGAEVLTGPRAGKAHGLVAFAGGVGTADCRAQAVKRGIPVAVVPPVEEPRVWNRHHGKPPGPSMYVGRGSPLGNPWPLELTPGERRIDAAPAALRKYAAWLLDRLDTPEIVNALHGISSAHYLVCSCWPAHCHAEVIVGAWRHVRGIPRSGYG